MLLESQAKSIQNLFAIAHGRLDSALRGDCLDEMVRRGVLRQEGEQLLLQTMTSTFCVAETILIHSEWFNSAPKYDFTSVLLISIFLAPASNRLLVREPLADPIPHWSFRSHFIFPIGSLSAPAVMCLGQRPRRERRSKSAHVHLAQVRLSYMYPMTLSILYLLNEPLSLAMVSSLECSTFPAVILTERRDHSRSLPRSNVLQLR
ncbi:hypothetical protein V8E53_012145 [Lactarius tabidus]